ncbi:hypothetical protein [Kluyvera ascorbata]|jgi:hypothetical protein|uniref:Tail fiber protein n=1 Tax=Caudovirales sp. ctLhN17 TaxID=2825764 RepID=A0A8S5NV55_9CAUD|nr:hypothetical protein [Kluyvera ascorbata]MDU3912285.1 hypothetical protein [Kluyvera ascorbata]DAD98311.1 MAG TPA: tail fiber protein [Caudovirales sp. ctLhN17]
MLRIGQVESSSTVDGKYTDGNVAGGIAATRLRAAAFNAMQEELAHIVESTGVALDVDDTTQVLVALQKIFAGNSDSLGALAALVGAANKLPYFTGPKAAALADLTAFAREILAQTDAAGVLSKLGLGNTKYGAPLIGQLVEWPLQQMPHEIWPDMGQEYIPYMAQSFDPVKYPLLSQLHPTNVLPADMRGYGVRGWDKARGVDTGRALMSAQSSGAPNLTGTVSNMANILGIGTNGHALYAVSSGSSSTLKAGTDSGTYHIMLDASKESTEYQAITEVRVKNVAWNMIVRAK